MVWADGDRGGYNQLPISSPPISRKEPDAHGTGIKKGMTMMSESMKAQKRARGITQGML